jgi:curved DNA-binding protein CbpA
MGQIFSKLKASVNNNNTTDTKENKENKNCYEILQVNQLMTSEEIKRNYKKLFFKNQRNLEEMTKINEAFQEIKNEIDLDLYYELYSKVLQHNSNGGSKEESLASLNNIEVINTDNGVVVKYQNYQFIFNFSTFTIDFFNKLSTAFQIKNNLPKDIVENEYCSNNLSSISSNNFSKFYNFWIRFSSNDKAIENKVRKIVRTIKLISKQKIDRNVNNSEVKMDSEQKDRSHDEKSKRDDKVFCKPVKNYKTYCNPCKKGFNNENTFKDHLNSKKHKELNK